MQFRDPVRLEGNMGLFGSIFFECIGGNDIGVDLIATVLVEKDRLVPNFDSSLQIPVADAMRYVF